MTQKTLTTEALNILNQYLHLPFSDDLQIPCPYINNSRKKVRAGLRVLIGKGSPQEIVEETKLIALREKQNLNKFTKEQLSQYLVDHNIGIDCSGLIYYVLSAEKQAHNKSSLRSTLKYTKTKNPLRRLIQILRPAENTNVKVLADQRNSKSVSLKNIEPGDMIIMLEAQGFSSPNHVLLIHKVEYEKNIPKVIYYTHSFAWKSEGAFGHGVRQGKILITNIKKSITEQVWEEKGEKKQHETIAHAKSAKIIDIKRLN